MSYTVKEIFYTLQGEGGQTGSAAVFCRFSGCNLWSGREQDRARARCPFCDTDFVGTDGPGGGVFDSSVALAERIAEVWGERGPQHRLGLEHRLVVLTGGEPLLQLDRPLVAELHARGFRVAIETNGTVELPPGIFYSSWVSQPTTRSARLASGLPQSAPPSPEATEELNGAEHPERLDWIAVSPKAGTELKLTEGSELKLVYPQAGLDPERFVHLDFERFYLQPCDGADHTASTAATVAYCLAHPRWRLSLQTHKLLNIP